MSFQAGLTPSEFWDLSWFELDAVFNGYQTKFKFEYDKLVSLREISVIMRNYTAAFYAANSKKGGRKIKEKDIIIFSWEKEMQKALKQTDLTKYVKDRRVEGAEKAKAFRDRWEGAKTISKPL